MNHSFLGLQQLVKSYNCKEYTLRLPSDIFCALSWLPLPLLDSTKEHYQPFESVYGKPVSTEDQPSLKGSGDNAEAAAAYLSNKDVFNAGKVRDVIPCQECYKPRSIIARGKLSTEQKTNVEEVKASQLYTCGCALFPPLLPFHGSLYARTFPAFRQWNHSITALNWLAFLPYASTVAVQKKL